MDLQKAKIFLDKINREMARMAKEPENIARIDVDIICAYTRELYDAFLSEKNTVAATAAAPKTEPVRHASPEARPVEFTPERPEPKPRREFVEAVVIPERIAPPAIIAAPVPAPQPIYEPAPEPPAPPKIVAPPIIEKAPEPAPAPVHHVPTPVFHQPFVSPESESLFEEKKARERSEMLAQTRIPDLTKGIGINDKLLFTKQLFGGNANAFSDALNSLNHFANFAEAKNYLVQNVVGRFDWLEKSRAEMAKTFIQLVRRRYN